MESINFLNIEYILLRLQEFLTGVRVDPSEVPNQALFIGGQIMLLGTAIAIIMVILLAYLQIKLHVTEHEGFHAKEAASHGAHGMEEKLEAPVVHKNERWEHVRTLAASAQESDWRRAIIEADIMLGLLLTEQGYRGQTIGDQLKDANPLQFTTLDLAWKAHKIRNDIAHGGESFHLSDRDVHTAIDYFGRVFEEFGFI